MAPIAKGSTNPVGFEPALSTRMRSPAFCRRMPSAKWLRHEFPVHRIRTKGFSCILLSGPTFSVTISPRSISKLNVPNRIWGLFHDSSNASVPPPCEAYGPRHSRSKTDVAVPFFANLRQIIGPYIGRATSVGTECNDDFVIWELGFRINLCQLRVIPLYYATQKDPCEGLRREFELRSHFRNVIGRYICAQYCWEVQDRHPSLCTVFFERSVIHRSVTRSEIENARCNFSDTRAGTNSLIFNLDIWMKLLKLSDPSRINRMRKCGPTSRQQRLPLGCGSR